MSDPLRDPQFPDRPQHPDFWSLSELTMKRDGQATEDGKTLPEFLDDVVDLDSLIYMARQRVRFILRSTGVPAEVIDVIESQVISAYIDAFLLGHDYHAKKTNQ